MFRFICIIVALVAIGNALPYLKEGRLVPREYSTTIDDHPYHVSIESNGKHISSGAIIAPNVILTSAESTHNLEAADIKVRAGSSKLEEGGVLMIVKALVPHERYMESRKDYDIAVVILESDLTYDDTIQPISLPSGRAAPSQDRLGMVSGWGVYTEDRSNGLESVQVKVPHPINCKNAYAPFIIYITDRMFCAGPSINYGNCKGDSGSPLIIGNELVGLSAWEQNCGSLKYPGIYTNVANLKKWVSDVVTKNTKKI